MAVESHIDERRSKDYIPHNPQAQVVYAKVQVSVDSAQVDLDTDSTWVVAGPFPTGTVVADVSSWKVVATDLDTGATPTLTFDFVIAADKEGASEEVLISNSTVGQGGGTDYLDGVDGTDDGLDLAGKYLVIVIEDDATTGADGTFTVHYATRVAPPLRMIDLSVVDGEPIS